MMELPVQLFHDPESRSPSRLRASGDLALCPTVGRAGERIGQRMDGDAMESSSPMSATGVVRLAGKLATSPVKASLFYRTNP